MYFMKIVFLRFPPAKWRSYGPERASISLEKLLLNEIFGFNKFAVIGENSAIKQL